MGRNSFSDGDFPFSQMRWRRNHEEPAGLVCCRPATVATQGMTLATPSQVVPAVVGKAEQEKREDLKVCSLQALASMLFQRVNVGVERPHTRQAGLVKRATPVTRPLDIAPQRHFRSSQRLALHAPCPLNASPFHNGGVAAIDHSGLRLSWTTERASLHRIVFCT
jgi:hypothetical protein